MDFNFTFIESLQFMSSSLSQLVENLKTGGIEKFKYMNQEFGGRKNHTELLTRKGVYLYSFMSDWTKFYVDVKELKIEHFKNDLTGDDIKKED